MGKFVFLILHRVIRDEETNENRNSSNSGISLHDRTKKKIKNDEEQVNLSRYL